MTQNAIESIYLVFYMGAEHRMTHWDMRTFFEQSTSYTLSTVMHITKEVIMHDETGYLILIYDRDFPLTIPEINELSLTAYVDFYDRMYIDYFNDVYGQNFIPTQLDQILPQSSVAIRP